MESKKGKMKGQQPKKNKKILKKRTKREDSEEEKEVFDKEIDLLKVNEKGEKVDVDFELV